MYRVGVHGAWRPSSLFKKKEENGKIRGILLVLKQSAKSIKDIESFDLCLVVDG